MVFRRPPRETRDRSEEFASVQIERPRAVMARGLDKVRPATAPPKIEGRAKQSIRDSARGEDCLVRLPGCPGDPAMTIWSHNRHQRAGKGAAIKAIDLNGAYCCTYCDAIYDGQRPLPAGVERKDAELAWFMAHAESLVRLTRKGIV